VPYVSENHLYVYTHCFIQLGNINKPDILEQFPEAAVAFKEKIDIDLNAGEALYIPGFDWHFVVSSGTGNLISQHC
jgi:hypothetical protein